MKLARLGAATLVVLALGAPIGAAQVASASGATVSSTDDAAGDGTCPERNSFGFATGGNCFIPDELTVPAGTTVTWKSEGKRPHDTVADDDSFRSPYLYPGDTWSWTFDTPGRFPYYCSLHGDRGGIGHAGVIVVVEPGSEPPEVPASGQEPSAGSEPASASGPSAASAPAAPTSIGTVLAVRQVRVADVSEAGESHAAPQPAGAPPFVMYLSGVAIGALLLAGWRFATGGQ